MGVIQVSNRKDVRTYKIREGWHRRDNLSFATLSHWMSRKAVSRCSRLIYVPTVVSTFIRMTIRCMGYCWLYHYWKAYSDEQVKKIIRSMQQNDLYRWHMYCLVLLLRETWLNHVVKYVHRRVIQEFGEAFGCKIKVKIFDVLSILCRTKLLW
jgi:hypothetical protein